MSSFVTNLVLRGAGLPPLPLAKPPARPLFPPELGAESPVVHEEQPPAPLISFTTSAATGQDEQAAATAVVPPATPPQPQPAPQQPAPFLEIDQAKPADYKSAAAKSKTAILPTNLPDEHVPLTLGTAAPALQGPSAPNHESPQPQPVPAAVPSSPPFRPTAQPTVRQESPLSLSESNSSETAVKPQSSYPEPILHPASPPQSVTRADAAPVIVRQNTTPQPAKPIILVQPASPPSTPMHLNPSPTASEQASTRKSNPTNVTVQIGTIEVQASLPAPPSQPRSAPRPQGFSRFTALRGGEGA